jgi:hypothetical protein
METKKNSHLGTVCIGCSICPMGHGPLARRQGNHVHGPNSERAQTLNPTRRLRRLQIHEAGRPPHLTTTPHLLTPPPPPPRSLRLTRFVRRLLAPRFHWLASPAPLLVSFVLVRFGLPNIAVARRCILCGGQSILRRERTLGEGSFLSLPACFLSSGRPALSQDSPVTKHVNFSYIQFFCFICLLFLYVASDGNGESDEENRSDSH